MIGEKEDGKGTEEFAKVGATDNDLRPGTVSENTLGECRSKGVLQEPMEVESQGITREEPCESIERLHHAPIDT
jgi:hypothetical protein